MPPAAFIRSTATRTSRKLQSYTVDLYKELEEISGQSCSLHLTGGVMLADTPERMDFLRLAQAKGRYLGMDLELIPVSEAKNMFPILDEKYFIGALWDPVEGHLDPSGTTHAYAKAARVNGAEIYRHTKVEELVQTPDGTWDVTTDKGTIRAEHVVNAGGLWARECGRMVGLELPILAMEHMYLLTEDMPEVLEFNEDRQGTDRRASTSAARSTPARSAPACCSAPTSRPAALVAEGNTPWDFGHELLAPDLDRIAPSLEVGFEHFPALENAGIKQVINGPFTFAPDGNPLVGPVRGLTNYWVACGVMAGFSQGGGVGLTLANWMVTAIPASTSGAWMSPATATGRRCAYTNAKVRENYSRRFRIRFPNEELPAARPHQTTPLYDVRCATTTRSWATAGAWKRRCGSRPQAKKPEDVVSFHRSNDFKHVGANAARCANGVGVTEIANFAKYEITGRVRRPGCRADDQHHAEDRAHHADADAERIRQADRRLHHRQGRPTRLSWSGDRRRPGLPHALVRKASAEGSVSIRATANLTLVGLSIAGPKAREVLAKAADDDVSKPFRFMDFARWTSAARPAWSTAITYTGDLGYEIWMNRLPAAGLPLRSRRPGEEFGIRISACARCSRCGLRRTSRPGSANCGRSTARSRPAWTASSSSARTISSAGSRTKEHEDGPKRCGLSFVVERSTPT
jgi:dimethylglycine dehydrogenase